MKKKVFQSLDDQLYFQNKMRREFKDIAENLPRNMLVRVYKSRVDLLRFVIFGPQGTPYHKCLLFFDVCFPCDYPDSPPLVCSHSGIVGFKPNLNNSDETPLIIPLILQSTTAQLQSMWVPGTTTAVQYFSIIQDNILKVNPLIFGLGMTKDDVGYACFRLLDENIIIRSLKTMLMTMKKPPKFFEFLVAGHYCNAADTILRACFHYMKDGVFSVEFRNAVASYIQPLVFAFNKFGAKVELEMRNKKNWEAVVRKDQLPAKYLEVKSSYGVCSIKNVLREYENSESTPMAFPSFKEDMLKRYEKFKKFDIVADDHLLSGQSTSAMNQLPQEWVERIHEEWKLCKEHLPDTIFVRVYEGRMDLLRAVFIGQEGTPYQDGLFFFDLSFPINYPNSPPLVSSHCGVLSNATHILKKTWVPGTSNILQFLVSIQGLFLSAKPMFFSAILNDKAVESLSLCYNETAIVNSVITMLYTMKNPPKHFEFFVAGHFYKRASEILLACRSYIKGLKVGCYANVKKTCSKKFMNDLASCIEPLVIGFNKLGAEVTEDEDMTVTEKEKSKICQASVTGEEDMSDIENTNRQVIDRREFLSMLKDIVTKGTQSTYIAPSTFTMVKVMVKEGRLVDSGQPLCVMGPRKQEDVSSWIKKILEGNPSSLAGIFSMENDRLLDHSHGRQMKGITAEDYTSGL